ncbi:MAG: hypothetical protein EOO99_02965 [Pedobacter sp.]|nr:MAG: hypothetical protein EOO99_02965 [Pedobacter sp.]
MQNYTNHKRYNKPFHFLFIPLLLGGVIYFSYTLLQEFSDIKLGMALAYTALIIIAIFSRAFALKAQDRAIRAEESLRYFMLTGKPIPKTLRIRQILALRFAEDTEFVQLVDRCEFDKLSSDEIKRSIIDWRADNYRI